MPRIHLDRREATRATRARLGFTMLEIMTSVALALMLMYSVARIFSRVGGAMNETTSIMEMTNSLRNVKNRLTTDLESLTLVPNPPANSQLDPGYFCYVEGLGGPFSQVSNPATGALAPFGTSDLALDTERLERYGKTADASGNVDYVDTTVGDTDDILSFTAKAPADKPFKGRYFRPIRKVDAAGNVVLDVEEAVYESQFAEIVWFLRGTTLYRRVLVIMPDEVLQESLNAFVVAYANGSDNLAKFMDAKPATFNAESLRRGFGFFRYYDVSVHTKYVNGVGYVCANTLGDLTNRANRYGYWNSFGVDTDDLSRANGVPTTTFSMLSTHGRSSSESPLAEAWYWLRLPTQQESSWWTFRAGYPFGATISGRSGGLGADAPFTTANGNQWFGDRYVLRHIENADANQRLIDSGTYYSSQLPVRSTPPKPFVDFWNNPNVWDNNLEYFNQVIAAGQYGAPLDSQTDDIAETVAYIDERFQQDVVLANVISFNVKAWDTTTNMYVDLGSGYNNGITDPTNLRSAGNYTIDRYLTVDGVNEKVWTRMPCVYDTWTEQYQANLYNYESILHTPGSMTLNGGLSDISSDSELTAGQTPEYPPPYATPIKSLQVEIRVFDPRSKEIRNATFNVDLTQK